MGTRVIACVWVIRWVHVGVRVCGCVCMGACVGAWVRVWVRECGCVLVCACVCVPAWEGPVCASEGTVVCVCGCICMGASVCVRACVDK